AADDSKKGWTFATDAKGAKVQKNFAQIVTKGLPVLETIGVKAGMSVKDATTAAKAIKTISKVTTKTYSSVTKYQSRKG
ncbi:MAG: hypothetical protein ACOYMH_10030, partial [Zwartia sp.]